MISWNREEPERSLSSMMDLCFEHDVNALSVSYPHSHLDAQYVRASLERLGFVCNDRVDLGVLHETDPKFHTEGEPRHFFKSGILSDSKYYQQQKQKPIGSLIFPEQERQKRQEREAEEQAYVENLLDGYKPPANSLLGAKEPRLVFRNVGFTFDSRLAPQVHEQKPRIHFFLTGVPTEVDASSMYVLDLNLDGSDTTGTLDFELPLDREVVRRYGLDRVFLNMHCYTEVPNERGDYCLNQAGYARAPLVLLLEQAKKNPGDMRTKKAAFELIVPAKPDLVKGVIEFDVSPTLSLVQFESPKTGERSDKRLLKRRVFLYPEEEETDAKRDRNALIAVRQQQQQGGLPRYERNLKDYHRLVSQYVEQVYKRYMRIQPTWKAIENIHAFQFVAPSGTLPASVFHRFPGAPKSSVAFWVNLVNVALGRIRDDWSWAKEVREGRVPRSAEEFGARDWSTDLDAEDPLEARLSSCVLSIVMTLYVNSCQYITDKIDTRNRKEPAYKREEERLREFERRSNRNGMWRSWKQLRYLSGSPNWIGQRQIVDEAAGRGRRRGLWQGESLGVDLAPQSVQRAQTPQHVSARGGAASLRDQQTLLCDRHTRRRRRPAHQPGLQPGKVSGRSRVRHALSQVVLLRVLDAGRTRFGQQRERTAQRTVSGSPQGLEARQTVPCTSLRGHWHVVARRHWRRVSRTLDQRG